MSFHSGIHLRLVTDVSSFRQTTVAYLIDRCPFTQISNCILETHVTSLSDTPLHSNKWFMLKLETYVPSLS
jgi:hypothetical protein